MKKKHKAAACLPEYTLMDELMASPTEPLPEAKRRYQLGVIQEGIEAMRTKAAPTSEDWAAVADLVNLLETLVEMGEIDDGGGWIAEALREMAEAAMRFQAGKPLRLTGAGLNAVANAFEGYELAISELPARTMVRVHRKTVARVRAIVQGKRRSADLVVAL